MFLTPIKWKQKDIFEPSPNYLKKVFNPFLKFKREIKKVAFLFFFFKSKKKEEGGRYNEEKSRRKRNPKQQREVQENTKQTRVC